MKQHTGKAVIAYEITTALLGWFALILQLYLIIKNAAPKGIPVAQAIGDYLSFFTILTNLIIAFSLTVSLLQPRSGLGIYFSRTSVKTGIALHIAIVGITYSLVLRNIWNPQGWQLIADRLLHDLIPILYILYWFIFVPKGSLKWKSVFPWFIYPTLYLVYALLLGLLTGRYPYPFLDVNKLGYAKIFLNALYILLAYLCIGLLLITFDRMMKKSYKPIATG